MKISLYKEVTNLKRIKRVDIQFAGDTFCLVDDNFKYIQAYGLNSLKLEWQSTNEDYTCLIIDNMIASVDLQFYNLDGSQLFRNKQGDWCDLGLSNKDCRLLCKIVDDNSEKIAYHLFDTRCLSLIKIDIELIYLDTGEESDYAQGIIEVLEEAINSKTLYIHLGGYYIIAPENGCSGRVEPSHWDEIWQYGSDEQRDPETLQDGVAPQCSVEEIRETRRAYIPDTESRGFLDSHSIANYKWIFNIQNINQRGYVTPRK